MVFLQIFEDFAVFLQLAAVFNSLVSSFSPLETTLLFNLTVKQSVKPTVTNACREKRIEASGGS